MSWSCRDVGVTSFRLGYTEYRDLTLKIENQIEKTMKHGMDTGFI